MKSYLLSPLLVLLSLCHPGYAQEHIGLILPLTGISAPFGAVVYRGVKSASVKGDLIVEDDQCEPQKSVSALQSLRQRGIELFLGPCCTTSALAVAPIIKRNKLLSLNVCTGTKRAWTLSDGRVFHAQYSAEEESKKNALMMWSRGLKNVVVLYMEHEYALAHERAFREAFPGKIVKSLSFSGTDTAQLKNLVLQLKTLKFDALYIPIVEPFFLGVLSEMAKVHTLPKHIFSVFSFELPDVLAAEGANAEGVIYSYPDIQTSEPAASYFASMGTSILEAAAEQCKGTTECVKEKLLASKAFDEQGFLRVNIIWKTVKDGHFVPLVNQ